MAESTGSRGSSAGQVWGSNDRPRQGDEGRLPGAHARKSRGPAGERCPGEERLGEQWPKDERECATERRATERERRKDERLKKDAEKLGFRISVVSYQVVSYQGGFVSGHRFSDADTFEIRCPFRGWASSIAFVRDQCRRETFSQLMSHMRMVIK